MALTYTVDGITVTYLGRTVFAENSLPLQSEVQWGLDSLQRIFIGAAPLLEDFINGLVKGSTFSYAGDTYYLIDWMPNGDKLWPEVSLNYLGLSNGTALPAGDDDVSPQSITISATVPTDADDPPEGEEDMTVEREIEYLAFQTTWRYITSARPVSALVGTVAIPLGPYILRSRITTSTGNTYAGANAPAGLVSATTPGVANVLLNLASTEVYATPFFEVQETIARMFVG